MVDRTLGDVSDVAVGLTDLYHSQNTYIWLDGSPLKYTNWDQEVQVCLKTARSSLIQYVTMCTYDS